MNAVVCDCCKKVITGKFFCAEKLSEPGRYPIVRPPFSKYEFCSIECINKYFKEEK